MTESVKTPFVLKGVNKTALNSFDFKPEEKLKKVYFLNIFLTIYNQCKNLDIHTIHISG